MSRKTGRNEGDRYESSHVMSKRPLDHQGDTMRMIWAYGEDDPVDDMTMDRHVERGTKSIYLKEPRFTPPTDTEDIKTWDILAPNVGTHYSNISKTSNDK